MSQGGENELQTQLAPYLETQTRLLLSMRSLQQNNLGQQMNIIRITKSLLAPPSPEAIALRELEESRRELLSAQTNQEFAAKMAEFHKGKIKRLTAFLKETMSEEQP